MHKILLTLFLAQPALGAFDATEHARTIGREWETEKMNERTLTAIEAALTFGCDKLRAKGHSKEADRIMSDWFYREKAFIFDSKSMGDHEPIAWLLEVWKTMDSILGTEVMKFGHLDDLWIFAYSTKVCILCQDNVDRDEYFRHFVGLSPEQYTTPGGFAGAVTYWTALIACSAGMTQPWSALCGPLAVVAEFAMQNFIAPSLSPKVWDIACK